MPFDKLETKHIANLIQSNPITCAHYYDHHKKCFQKLCIKDDMIFGPLLKFFFVTKTVEVNKIMDFCGLQMPQHMVWTLIKSLKILWINI
jgi:hypothetical protein